MADGIQLEGAVTNLITDGEDLTNGWVNSADLTITADAGTIFGRPATSAQSNGSGTSKSMRCDYTTGTGDASSREFRVRIAVVGLVAGPQSLDWGIRGQSLWAEDWEIVEYFSGGDQVTLFNGTDGVRAALDFTADGVTPLHFEAKVTGLAEIDQVLRLYIYPGGNATNTHVQLISLVELYHDTPVIGSYVPSPAIGTRAATSCTAPFTGIPGLPDEGLTNDFCGQLVLQVDNDADMVALAIGESTGSMDNSYEVRRIGGTWQFVARRGALWGSVAQVADASALVDVRFRASSTDGMKIWVNAVPAEQVGETDPLSAPATAIQLDDRMGGGLQGFGIYKSVRIIPVALPDDTILGWP